MSWYAIGMVAAAVVGWGLLAFMGVEALMRARDRGDR